MDKSTLESLIQPAEAYFDEVDRRSMVAELEGWPLLEDSAFSQLSTQGAEANFEVAFVSGTFIVDFGFRRSSRVLATCRLSAIASAVLTVTGHATDLRLKGASGVDILGYYAVAEKNRAQLERFAKKIQKLLAVS